MANRLSYLSYTNSNIQALEGKYKTNIKPLIERDRFVMKIFKISFSIKNRKFSTASIGGRTDMI